MNNKIEGFIGNSHIYDKNSEIYLCGDYKFTYCLANPYRYKYMLNFTN